MMKFKKILVTGFDRTNLDENVWTRIQKSTDQIVFKPSSPQALKPSSPQALKPSSPQALKPSSPNRCRLLICQV